MVPAVLLTSALATGSLIGSVSSTAQPQPWRPSHRKLMRAAREGNVGTLRRVVLETPLKDLRLDDALAAAAANARLNAMSFLIDSGAADLDRALLRAAMRDHVAAAKFLISEERVVPAENLSSARVAAASTSALNVEWLLLLAMREDRKRNL